MLFKFVIISVLCIDRSKIASEWVDMPQFSDEKKIYRLPFQKYIELSKLSQEHDRLLFHEDRNMTEFDQSTKVQNDSTPVEQTVKYKIIKPDSVSPIIFNGPILPFGMIEGNWSTNTSGFTRIDDISTEQTTEAKVTNRYLADTSQEMLTSSEEYSNETIEKPNLLITDYLPIDVLKNVHRLLTSQPVSLEGKMHFLKSFERTLLSEIETQLDKVTAPSRKVRSARDHFIEHDEHDDHGMGFPSIEGALMAISFLTFAVYLVRLVMQLFRNMTTTMPPVGTTGATVFLGKRKRSIDRMDDDTARLFQGIENFVSTV